MRKTLILYLMPHHLLHQLYDIMKLTLNVGVVCLFVYLDPFFDVLVTLGAISNPRMVSQFHPFTTLVVPNSVCYHS